MAQIQILPPQVANQIAAGEVVERPASIVKELVENSIDAGATNIQIDIEEGGKELIRIRDNGSGIVQEELDLALAPHATSKLRILDDLSYILSYGFRGEALASISSVSKLTLTSRHANADLAWQIYNQGKEYRTSSTPVAHPQGTTIEVKELFYNTPARQKFLKSGSVEFNHIEDLICRMAIVRPEIDFTLNHNGKQRLRLPALSKDSFKQRVQQVLPRDFSNDTISIKASVATFNLHLELIIDPHNIYSSRASKSQYSFINNRMIKDKVVISAVKQAFSELFSNVNLNYVLFLTIDSDALDINVHPAKAEVRFVDAHKVHSFIFQNLYIQLAQVKNFDPKIVELVLANRNEEASLIDTNNLEQNELKQLTQPQESQLERQTVVQNYFDEQANLLQQNLQQAIKSPSSPSHGMHISSIGKKNDFAKFTNLQNIRLPDTRDESYYLDEEVNIDPKAAAAKHLATGGTQAYLPWQKQAAPQNSSDTSENKIEQILTTTEQKFSFTPKRSSQLGSSFGEIRKSSPNSYGYRKEGSSHKQDFQPSKIVSTVDTPSLSNQDLAALTEDLFTLNSSPQLQDTSYHNKSSLTSDPLNSAKAVVAVPDHVLNHEARFTELQQPKQTSTEGSTQNQEMYSTVSTITHEKQENLFNKSNSSLARVKDTIANSKLSLTLGRHHLSENTLQEQHSLMLYAAQEHLGFTSKALVKQYKAQQNWEDLVATFTNSGLIATNTSSDKQEIRNDHYSCEEQDSAEELVIANKQLTKQQKQLGQALLNGLEFVQEVGKEIFKIKEHSFSSITSPETNQDKNLVASREENNKDISNQDTELESNPLHTYLRQQWQENFAQELSVLSPASLNLLTTVKQEILLSAEQIANIIQNPAYADYAPFKALNLQVKATTNTQTSDAALQEITSLREETKETKVNLTFSNYLPSQLDLAAALNGKIFTLLLSNPRTLNLLTPATNNTHWYNTIQSKEFTILTSREQHTIYQVQGQVYIVNNQHLVLCLQQLLALQEELYQDFLEQLQVDQSTTAKSTFSNSTNDIQEEILSCLQRGKSNLQGLHALVKENPTAWANSTLYASLLTISQTLLAPSLIDLLAHLLKSQAYAIL